jgi:hypothetical protein
MPPPILAERPKKHDKPDLLEPGRTPPPKPRRVADNDAAPDPIAKQASTARQVSADAISTTMIAISKAMIPAGSEEMKIARGPTTDRGSRTDFALFDEQFGHVITRFADELHHLRTVINDAFEVSQSLRTTGIGSLESKIAEAKGYASKREDPAEVHVNTKDLHTILDGIEQVLKDRDKSTGDRRNPAAHRPTSTTNGDVIAANTHAAIEEMHLLRMQMGLDDAHKVPIARRVIAFVAEVNAYRIQTPKLAKSDKDAIKKLVVEIKELTRQAMRGLQTEVHTLGTMSSELEKAVH